MERYNYDLIRDRVVRMISEKDWPDLPFDKSFLSQAICLGAPVYRLKNWVPLTQETNAFTPEWGKEIVAELASIGEMDHDKLDQAMILRSYDLVGIDESSGEPKYEPKNYYVLVVHIRNVKMACISGITLLTADRASKVVFQKSFSTASSR
jgi:hypothetical protein